MNLPLFAMTISLFDIRLPVSATGTISHYTMGSEITEVTEGPPAVALIHGRPQLFYYLVEFLTALAKACTLGWNPL